MPLYFASAFTRDAYAYGILVETHEGRPTKIEGHPEHRASLGATCPSDRPRCASCTTRGARPACAAVTSRAAGPPSCARPGAGSPRAAASAC
ncbi:hypothetical protein [Nannocystis pusilla]|uniref:hypothetical protein n=1 Tax=Nannocystis pusilla TaxID=889268 RepID=UPI003B7D813B